MPGPKRLILRCRDIERADLSSGREKQEAFIMASVTFDDEREDLDHRKRELEGQLRRLLEQKDALTPLDFDQRQEALHRQIHEIEHRLADLYLDEQGMHRMEGGE